ncbi:MAG: hypothetical protein P1U49_15775 [Minwuia sp.]|nr:hypothetical protein [Minwuia sp.]
MSRSYWRAIIAALGISLTCASYAQEEAEDPPRTEERTAEDGSEPRDSQQPIDLTAIENLIKRIATAIEAEENQEDRSWEKDYASRDLDAQEGMAKWTFWILITTGASVVVTAAGVILVYFTLKHSRRAADAAFKMVDEAKETTKAGKDAALAAFNQAKTAENAYRRLERPYLLLRVEHVGGLHKPGSNTAHIKIRFHNHGRLPAVLVSVKLRLLDAPDPTNLRLSAWTERKIYEIIDTGGRSEEFVVSVESATPGKSWNGKDATRLILVSRIEYLGPFGARHIDGLCLRFLDSGNGQTQEGGTEHNYRETIEPEDAETP